MTDYEFGDPRLPRRFWDKVRVNDETGCWEWTAGLSHGGYGNYWLDGRDQRAHRVTYATFICELPEWHKNGDPEIDHLCRVRACCNPAHLEIVTRRENVLRGESIQAENARKTHCLRGHELSGANLVLSVVDALGWRNCAVCVAERDVILRDARIALGITQSEYCARFGNSRAKAEAVIGAVQSGIPVDVVAAKYGDATATATATITLEAHHALGIEEREYRALFTRQRATAERIVAAVESGIAPETIVANARAAHEAIRKENVDAWLATLRPAGQLTLEVSA